MCGRGACSLGLRARLGRRADPDGVLVCGAFSNVIGALSHPNLKSFRTWTRLGAHGWYNPLGLAMPCTRREGILPPCASRGGRATGVRPSISSARLRACARNAKTQVSKFCGFLFVVILTCVRNTVRCERPVATCYDLRRTCQLRATGLNLATGLPARTKREGDPTGESVIRAARALADASRARLVSRW